MSKLVGSSVVAKEPNGFQSDDDDYDYDYDDDVENDNKNNDDNNDGGQVHYNRDCTYSRTKVYPLSNTLIHSPFALLCFSL